MSDVHAFTTNVYTDGHCARNGAKGATAGVGVYFGHLDPRNVSEALSGPVQTNQRAELTALIRTLEHITGLVFTTPAARFIIWSDSKYCVQGYNSWMDNWVERGWLTAARNPVKNRDLWEQTVALRDSLVDVNTVEVRWVKGHSGNPGNDAVDALAKKGGTMHPARKTEVFTP
jgi:ribonuclease HI